MCIARNIVTNKNKFEDRGKQCIWVGYADGHAVGTHRLINPRTKRIIFSRDVHFLDKSFGQWAKIEDPVYVPVTPDTIEDSSDDEILDMPQMVRQVSVDSEENDDTIVPRLIADHSSDDDKTSSSETDLNIIDHYEDMVDSNISDNDDEDKSQSENTTINPKVVSAMKKLDVSYNDEARKIVEEAQKNDTINLVTGRDFTVEDERLNFLMDLVDLSMNVEDLPNPDYVIPKIFDEAWNHPDPVQREKWREAIRKEFHDMNKRHVWRFINRRDIPPNRRCVKCKWVFNITRNKTWRKA